MLDAEGKVKDDDNDDDDVLLLLLPCKPPDEVE